MKYLKGIIISSSNQTIKNAKLKEKDEAIYRRFIKKTGPPSNNTQSEMGAQSSAGLSENMDYGNLNKQALEIIGDGLIPQNESWIEKLSEFIKYVYENHKHIKLIGCQFGSLLIAYALGGKIREKNNSDVGNYIGKEEVNLRKHFFNNSWVEEIIEYDELQDGEQEEIQKIGLFKVSSDSVAELP